jgi:hypothetical protein
MSFDHHQHARDAARSAQDNFRRTSVAIKQTQEVQRVARQAREGQEALRRDRLRRARKQQESWSQSGSRDDTQTTINRVSGYPESIGLGQSLVAVLLIALAVAAAYVGYRTVSGDFDIFGNDCPSRRLQMGASGSDVRDLQSLLNGEGFSLTVDGEFGASTQRAIRAYQATNAITADGIVGPRTWNSLCG